jgi:hypothetical protein
MLKALADDGVDLSKFWFEDELKALMAKLDQLPEEQPIPSEQHETTCPECGARFVA